MAKLFLNTLYSVQALQSTLKVVIFTFVLLLKEKEAIVISFVQVR